MIELSQHIETLLLENDCVIVPRLGGFVAHYQPATYVEEEQLFLPPVRIVGFNPQLKMNDGLLVQSFMSVYGNSFSDATRMIDEKVDALLDALHENGRVQLPQIGELRCSIYNQINFQAYDNKLTTPSLYGLGSFQIKPLQALQKSATSPVPAPMSVVVNNTQTDEETPVIKLQTNHRKLRIGPAWTAAMVAVVVMAFLYIYPFNKVETPVNYTAERAQIIPTETLSLEPVSEEQPAISLQETQTDSLLEQPTIEPETPVVEAKPQPVVKETPTEKPVVTAQTKRYHVIVASMATEGEVHKMVEKLQKAGHSDAKPIIGGGKMRVCIASYATMDEANEAAKQQQSTYNGAWVLKK